MEREEGRGKVSVERVVEGSSASESPSISCTIDGGIDGLGWSTDGLNRRE